jgi:endonuclease YncB( thermonuclease family)
MEEKSVFPIKVELVNIGLWWKIIDLFGKSLIIQVKVINSGNEIESKHKPASSVSVFLSKNPEYLYLPDDIFNGYSNGWYSPILLFIFFVIILLIFYTTTQILTGRVVNVADSDTITIFTSDNKQHRIRLAEIDAPEKGQDFSEKSRQHLQNLVTGKNRQL